MAADEQQDWVDRAMVQSVWEPPAGFTDRVVVQVMAALPPRRIRSFSRQGLLAAITGVLGSIRSRVELSRWVLAQYRELIFRSG